MLELFRVLCPDGVALVQVPWRPGPTDEDPSAPAEERLRRFGQADHVRYYGDDFVHRLTAAGLQVQPITPQDFLSAATCRALGITPNEQVWICTREGTNSGSIESITADVARAVEGLVSRAVQTWYETGVTEITRNESPVPPRTRTPLMKRIRRRAGRAKRKLKRSLGGSRTWTIHWYRFRHPGYALKTTR
jgi:hypothetical protein